MSASFFLSSMNAHDLDNVCAIENLCFTSPWSRNLMAEELCASGANNLILRQGVSAKVVAYACFRVQVGEMHLLKIAVHPFCRRQGLGLFLLEACLDQARAKGAKSAFLEVREHNANALALYKNAGFLEVGKRPNYYPETGETALILQRNL